MLFTPRENPFTISNELLKEIISEFILEHSTNIILQRIKISKYKLLKILTSLRQLMIKHTSEIFQVKLSLKSEPETSKEPVIGILAKENKVFAKILNFEPEEINSVLKEGVKTQEEWMKNFALVYKNSFYRLVPKKSSEIDALEVFWGYLKRKLSEKGGIRKEKLDLYVGEYAWRFNHRSLSIKEQQEILFNLIFKKNLSTHC